MIDVTRVEVLEEVSRETYWINVGDGQSGSAVSSIEVDMAGRYAIILTEDDQLQYVAMVTRAENVPADLVTSDQSETARLLELARALEYTLAYRTECSVSNYAGIPSMYSRILPTPISIVEYYRAAQEKRRQ